MPHYPHQKVRDVFAYNGPEPKCDCELLQTEYCCQHEDLEHTGLVEQQQLELSLDQGRRHALCRVEIRQCPTCQQLWWMHLKSEVHETHERDSFPPVVIGTVNVTFSSAVRCPNRTSADLLTAWYPKFLDAVARCTRIYQARRGDLIGAVRTCVELAAVDERTAMLADSTDIPRESDATRQRHDARLRACITTLEQNPRDSAAWEELQKLQSWCQRERLLDPAFKPQHWTTEELWTPALAGVGKLEFEIWAARNAARGKPLGSAQHAELRRIEDAIATAWEEHMRIVVWPNPATEFHVLVEHARSLQPEVVSGDKASWEHPKKVCMRIYWLISRLGVKPSWRVQVADWIAERTGLPDGAKRTHESACRRALLDRRRRQRRIRGN